LSTEPQFKKAHELITNAKTVAIVGHVRPDGDCVGCGLALNIALTQMGKDVKVFFDGEIPTQFSYMEGFDKIQTQMPVAGTMFDLLIIIDMSTADRMGAFQPIMGMAKKILCFDHHIGFDIKSDVAISDATRASCGEILYEFFIANKMQITRQIAEALYTSVSTDTGCFLYPSTSANTHFVAAELMKIGVDSEMIHYINFRVYDRHLIKGLKQILRNLRFRCGGQISFTRIKDGSTYDAPERHKFKQYISDIKGVRVSILLSQDARHSYHVSLRSHGNVNVEIPAKHFGGGGHKNASGFTINGKYKKVVKQILAQVEKLLHDVK